MALQRKALELEDELKVHTFLSALDWTQSWRNIAAWMMMMMTMRENLELLLIRA